MKNILPLLCMGVLMTSASLHAQTIVFSDSFENDTPGYNEPDSSSNPPYNSPVGNSVNQNVLVQIITGPIKGQDGNQALAIDNSGNGLATDLLTSKNGDAGTFALATTYTLSVEMQNGFGGLAQPGDLFTGILQLRDGTTGTVLDSVSHNFATGDANFNTYSFTFDTLTDPSIALAADSIQIGLEADSSAGSFQAINFDNVILTATPDVVIPSVPEPTTCVLLGLGALTLLGLRRARLS